MAAALADRGITRLYRHQAAAIRRARAGAHTVVAAGTASGKSLCYQLPGIARGGTTLVVSPLIALMEDQVAQLRGHGLVAERIHSGRSREESRDVCQAYLDGELDPVEAMEMLIQKMRKTTSNAEFLLSLNLN